MSVLAHALTLALAAAPTAQTAAELEAKASWDELYLAFSAAKPTAFSDQDKKRLAASFGKGTRALLSSDPVMAYSLAELFVLFEPSPESRLALADAAEKSDQKSAAETVLREGMKLHPDRGEFGLRLGKLLLDEKDPKGAAEALARVPKKSKEAKDAQALLAKANAQLAEESEAARIAAAVETQIHGGGKAVETKGQGGLGVRTAKGKGGADQGSIRSASSLTYESGVGPGGMRTRGNSRFTFRYFNGERDFGQRAEYEGKVAAALDTAHDFTVTTVGRARSRAVDVVLYTKEEFALHHGVARARAVAGFYSDHAIRLNDAAELDDHAQAVLVHEYVHAAVAEWCLGREERVPRWLNEGLAEWIEWRYQGQDGPPVGLKTALREQARAGKTPSLATLNDAARFYSGNPQLQYGTGAIAVKVLLKNGGYDNLLGLLEELGSGTPFAKALSSRYGRSVEELDRDVRDELSGT